MQTTNRQLRLQSRPKGLLAPGDLQLVESPVPELKDGQALARLKYISSDPTIRAWLAADTYLHAVPIREIRRPLGSGGMIESRRPRYARSDRARARTALDGSVRVDAT